VQNRGVVFEEFQLARFAQGRKITQKEGITRWVIPTNGSAGTGDEAQILFWSSAMVVSFGALAALLAESRKRRSVK
jgi:hypothetical protein